MHQQRLRKHGSLEQRQRGHPKIIDLAGQRFGSLVAVARDVPRGGVSNGFAWRLDCDCGGEAKADANALLTGMVVACGNSAVHRQKAWVGYNSMHQRTRRIRGTSSSHPCAECGEPAREWAYDYTDPNEMVENGLRYSLDVNRYQPMCAHCHRLNDAQVRRSK